MNFYNLCSAKLYTEAKTIIEAKTDWVEAYKSQTLSSVIDELERGVMIRTANGGHTAPYKVSDVKSIVENIALRDEVCF